MQYDPLLSHPMRDLCSMVASQLPACLLIADQAVKLQPPPTAAMSASMSASSSSLHGDPSDDPSHNPFMSEPVSEGIVAEAREERVEQEEQQQQQQQQHEHAEAVHDQPQQRLDGYNLPVGDGAQHSTAQPEHASSSTTSPQQQQQQQARRPNRPTLRDNTQWKDEIKVGGAVVDRAT